jgi:uncharacterized membrane protein (UPF0127 family)
MKSKKICLNYKGKKFEVDLKVCSEFEKFSGLMFSRREKAKALLFEFKKPTKIRIHSLFVFFPFVAIWLDEKNNIIDVKIVKSFKFSFSPKKPFIRLIEIPLNKNYSEVVKPFVTDGFPVKFKY